MPKHTELHLVVPGICGPLAETRTLSDSSAVNHWLGALSKASHLSSPGHSNELIADILSLNFQNDFPAASCTMLATGMHDDSLFYMFADPVHLQADMDHAVLTSSADLNINSADSTVLCDALNQHFEPDDLTFLLLNKDQWIVTSKNKIQLNTTPLSEATGRNINFILPAGEGALRWKQILTEAQMLLHSHQINDSRESAGDSSINSLWFHGCGEINAPDFLAGKKQITSLCSNDAMLKGLAVLLQCNYMAIPRTVSDYAEYLSDCERGSVHLLHLTQLEHLVNYSDVRPWLSQLTDTTEHWVYPLIRFSNKNNIRLILYPGNGNKYQFSKYDSLKFWRKDKLEEHVSSY